MNDTEIHDRVSEIVIDHKQGKIAYHVALDMITDLGMIQKYAHELLFPPLGEDDFDVQIPFDPTDIMQIEVKNNLRSEEE
tara:strand:+ start:637 stop:876 length:240 start_codon:yes stop_codon:yes gene_type:complete